MKRLILCVLSLLIATTSLVMIGCDKSPTNDDSVAYIDDSVAFSNGVQFSVGRYIFKKEIQVGLITYKTDNIFLCIEVIIENNSNDTFLASATDIWLLYGESKIGQVDIVKKWVDGYYGISQSPTTTKTYVTCFELSADIPLSELVMTIDNGSWYNNEQVKILLKNNPTT